MLGEINELTGYSYGVTDQRLAETRIELNKTTVAKNALKEKGIDIQQRYEQQAATVRKAQENFNGALNGIPAGTNAMRLPMVEAVADSLINGKNRRKELELAGEALKLAQEQYEKIFVELMAHHDQMMQVMVQLASLDMTKMDYEQIIPILQQAIRFLSEIRVHWGRLIEFFDNLRIRVQVERVMSERGL